MKRFYVPLTVLWLSLTVGAQSVSDARWLTLPSAPTTKVTHYSLDWDFSIQRLNAGFLFSGNAAHNTFYMWQINLETGKALLRPHICLNGTFRLLTEVDISSLVSLRQDENETHHLHLDIDGNVVTTTIDHVVVSTFQVPYDEVSYGEFGIRQYGNEAAYFDNMLVQDLSSPDAPRTLIGENFESYAALEGGRIVTQPDGNGRIGIAGTTNWYVPAQNGIPVFRKTFTLPGEVRRAVLQASALGVYNTFVNGTRVGDQELTPGWTDYRKEVAYQEYDVTPMLLPGDNCLAAEVSGGWWGGDIAHGAYGSHPGAQFVASLHIDLADGTSMVIPTDDTWLSAQCGRVVAADIYDGETYDARRPDDWKTAAYDASSWTRATVAQGAHPTLFRQTSPQVRVRATLERQPEKVTVYQGNRATGTTYGMINIVSEAPELSDITLRKGQTMLVDLGQNMVGWADFTVQGAAGTKMTVRHGEMLNYNGDANRLDKGPGGSLWTYNLRTADATVNYILSGDSTGETYHPSHTFMGFRYIELTADNDIVVRRVAGKVVGSDNGCKLSTGFVGTGILCTTLSDTGMDDLAYALLQQRKNPSWLYSVDQGATTIWERWDSYTVEGGFNKHPWNMNSFNHYSYGAVAEWLYAGIAGIQTPAYAPTSTAEGGWKHLVLCPHPDTRTEAQIEAVGGERMMWAEAETRMPQGTVAAKWTRKPDGRITYVVTIPKGVVATVKMPRLTTEDQVTVDGTAVGNGQPDGSRLSFELAGGTYTVDCLAPTSTAVGMPVTTGNDASKETYYNLAGQKQSRPAKGINLSSRGYAFIQN